MAAAPADWLGWGFFGAAGKAPAANAAHTLILSANSHVAGKDRCVFTGVSGDELKS
jgi:hypothetical protein